MREQRTGGVKRCDLRRSCRGTDTQLQVEVGGPATGYFTNKQFCLFITGERANAQHRPSPSAVVHYHSLENYKISTNNIIP